MTGQSCGLGAIVIEALSVLGSVMGILAGLITVVAFLRRRDRIRVTDQTVMGRPAEATFEITATNVGTHDVTLIALGFVVAKPLAEPRAFPSIWSAVQRPFLKRRLGKARRYSDLGIEDGEQLRVLLEPSDQVTRVLDLAYVTGWLTPGERAWTYAETSLGHEIYDKRPASLYVWSGDGWIPTP